MSYASRARIDPFDLHLGTVLTLTEVHGNIRLARRFIIIREPDPQNRRWAVLFDTDTKSTVTHFSPNSELVDLKVKIPSHFWP